jgi:DMSO/TMAO reductase YedYZ molybdopterin-dependent catalytic subunit
MDILNRFFEIPFYQKTEPRPAEIIEKLGEEIVISPDTRRERRLPPGQSRTKKFPVLDAHGTPHVDLENWTFQVEGLIENPKSWTLAEFLKLPMTKVYADFHCVTRWSRLDNIWTGVSARWLADAVKIKESAKYVVAAAYDTDIYGKDWTTNMPIEYFLNEDSLLAFEHDGKPIPPEHGGPVRLIVPQLYAWKSAKWIKGLKFVAEDEAGYWEKGGYHLRGVPWNGADGERFRW